MWGIRAAATRPDRRAHHEEARLEKLVQTLGKGEITLDMAEDGAVLARRARRPDLEQEFKKSIAQLKSKR